MGYFKALLVAYFLGGITFIPLLILAVFAHGYYTFPVREDVGGDHDPDGIIQPGDDTAPLEAAKNKDKRDNNDGERARSGTDDSVGKSRSNQDLDVAAGYFAVCREYTPMGVNAKPIDRPTPAGSATVAQPSPSVYQTMYRSIFDRKPASGPLDKNSLSNRPKKAGNMFYVVLRHGHLMLFDDDEQLEVRHVISLAHHDISLYSGGGAIPEGELFIKRNALCLSRRDGPELAPDSSVSKPFYLFSENCSAKEDFYFALLKNQEQTFGYENMAPSPKQFDVKNIIGLVQRLHASEDHVHSRWLNAVIGRLFLGLHRTRDIENLIREKITKKISRVKRPSYLTNINIQKIDTGDAAPYFTNLKLRDLTVEGECVVEADVRYTGNFRIEVTTTAKIDLGTRFKAREVNLVLAVMLKRIEGHVLFKIKPPPSNRLWFSFLTMPKMEMTIEPIVSSRQITYTVILRQIENRIKEVMAETVVQPFWDDTPFFRTEHKKWRGGIFEGDDAIAPKPGLETKLAQAGDTENVTKAEDNPELVDENRALNKSQTIPALDTRPAATGLFGRKLGRTGTNPGASLSSSNLDATRGTSSSMSPRSPSIVKNTPEPVVATETAHADIFKPSSSPPDHATSYMAALHSRSQDNSPMPTPIGSPSKPSILAKTSSYSSSMSSSSSIKDDVSGDKADETEATPIAPGRRDTTSSATSSVRGSGSGSNSPTISGASSIKSQAGSIGRGLFSRREEAGTSAPNQSAGESSGDTSTQKRNTFAAMTNAAVQARHWGWNAIQRQKDGRRNGDHGLHVDLSQPMGRGQPLPPPGTPLPGPTNGRTRLGPKPPSVNRKPVSVPTQDPERPRADSQDADKENPTPPPLPQRRRHGESYDPVEDETPNMLVVAAPDDSQPTTPSAEDTPEFGERRDQADTDAGSDTESGPTDESKAPFPEATQAHSVPADESQDSLEASRDDDLLPSEAEEPIMAMPAAASVADNVVDDDDDDGFEGWMDDDGDDDQPPTPQRHLVPSAEA